MKAKSLLLLLVALLSACSLIPESKKIDYKSAGKLPPLELPPDLSAPGRDETYVVPDVAGVKGGASFSAYAAERTGKGSAVPREVLPDVGKVRMERAGTQRWLVVPLAPEDVWPLVKEFWQSVGFVVNIERPEAGVMETDWAENRAKIGDDFIRKSLSGILDSLYSTAERDKYRTRIEAGSEKGTTEIYVSHRGMYEIYISEGKDQTRWQPREPDPDLEAEMLRRLMVKFGIDEAKSTAAIAATKPVADRAKLLGRAGDANGALELQEGFDRAWRRIGLALDRVGFTVEDRDRSKGIYYVRYVPPESDVATKKGEKSFLTRMMFWKGDEKTVADNRYRILVQSDERKSSVQVLSREGGADTSDTSKKILGLLYEQLK